MREPHETPDTLRIPAPAVRIETVCLTDCLKKALITLEAVNRGPPMAGDLPHMGVEGVRQAQTHCIYEGFLSDDHIRNSDVAEGIEVIVDHVVINLGKRKPMCSPETECAFHPLLARSWCQGEDISTELLQHSIWILVRHQTENTLF